MNAVSLLCEILAHGGKASTAHHRGEPAFAALLRHRYLREAATKFGKSIDTFFAKGFEDSETVLAKWLIYLDEAARYGPDDPLFPATTITAQANTRFEATGFERRPWKSTEPVCKIVNGAFARASQPNYGPHAFRHMLARFEQPTPISRRKE